MLVNYFLHKNKGIWRSLFAIPTNIVNPKISWVFLTLCTLRKSRMKTYWDCHLPAVCQSNFLSQDGLVLFCKMAWIQKNDIVMNFGWNLSIRGGAFRTHFLSYWSQNLSGFSYFFGLTQHLLKIWCFKVWNYLLWWKISWLYLLMRIKNDFWFILPSLSLLSL